MYFKIDVSDRETGEIATLEVESPTAPLARRYLENAGYMIWATEPAAGVIREPTAEVPVPPDPQIEAASHARFLSHPARFLLSPLCRFLGSLCLWLAVAMWVLHPTLPPLPLGIPSAPSTVAGLGLLLWTLGIWIGRPLALGRCALRKLADAQLVCRYCRRRGQVRTHTAWWSMRLWGSCGTCGLRWLL